MLPFMIHEGLGEVTNEFYEKVIEHDFSWIMPTSVDEVRHTMSKCMFQPPQIPNQVWLSRHRVLNVSRS